MRKHCVTVIVAILLVLGGGSPASAQAPKDELAHPKTLDELKKAMADVVEKNHLPGAGVALVSHGELLWCGGFGKADIAAGRDITCDTEFRVGSVSKTFVALALLKLEEEGKINLQARLQDLLHLIAARVLGASYLDDVANDLPNHAADLPGAKT